MMGTPTARIFSSTLTAAAISAAFELGLLEQLERDGVVHIRTYCKENHLHEPSMWAILRTLACFDIVEVSDENGSARRGGLFFDVFSEKGYFMWLVRGYGYLLQHLASLVRLENRPHDSDDRTFVQRDGKYIAMAGCDYGAHFVDQHFDEALNEQPYAVACDLGCGGAGRLIKMAARFPDFRGVGVDVNPDAVLYAREAISRAGFERRLKVVEGNVGKLEHQSEFAEVEVLFCFFMGHDLWPQERCISCLHRLREVFPNVRRFLLCDTYRSAGIPLNSLPIFTLGFELTHAVMGQQIPLESEWLALFDESGWVCANTREVGIPFSKIFDLRPSRTSPLEVKTGRQGISHS